MRYFFNLLVVILINSSCHAGLAKTWILGLLASALMTGDYTSNQGNTTWYDKPSSEESSNSCPYKGDDGEKGKDCNYCGTYGKDGSSTQGVENHGHKEPYDATDKK